MVKNKNENVTVTHVEYYPDRKLYPNNLERATESIHEFLVCKHGVHGRVIMTKEYHSRPLPLRPSILNDATPDIKSGIEYSMSLESFLQETRAATKYNSECLHQRSLVFGDMYGCIKQSARDRLSIDPTYADIVAKGDDPIALWALVELRLTTNIIGNESVARSAAREAYHSFKQSSKMSLIEFNKGFKHRYDLMLVNKVDPLSDGEQAYDFLNGLYPPTYSTMLDCIDNGILSRPGTLVAAVECARRWKTHRGNESSYVSAITKSARQMRHSGRSSEHAQKMYNLKVMAAASGYAPGSCFGCGSRTHTIKDCPDIEEFYLADSDDCDESNVTTCEPCEERSQEAYVTIGREMLKTANAYFGAKKSELNKGTIGLDSMCSSHIMGNTKLLTDIVECEPLHFNGIGGREKVHRKGTHPSWGEVYVREGDERINLLSLSMLEETPGYKIRYSQDNGVFYVTSKDGKEHEFSRKGGRLYVCNDTSKSKREHQGLVVEPTIESVENNLKLYTLKEIKAAERARALSAALGHASRANLHHIVRNGRVADLGINHHDIRRAKHIYGDPVEVIRGKTMQRKTKLAAPIVGKVVEPNLVMHTDIMFVCGEAFLVSVFKPLMLTLCTYLATKSTSDVKKAIDKQVSTVHSEGFKVIEITCDGEGAVGALKSDLDRLGCRVTIHSKSTHSADIDVKIRELKGVMRACSVGHSEFPFVLLSSLVNFCVSKINMMPSRVNSHGYSAMEQFLGRSISIDRDLGGKGGNGPLAFGSRVEIFDRTSNTMADRTSPALFLGSKSNSYGSALFFKLDTRRIVSSDQWKALPMDAGTISRINEIARAGRPFPKTITMYYAGKPVRDLAGTDVEVPRGVSTYSGRVVVDSGNDMPTGGEIPPGSELPVQYEIVRADEPVRVEEPRQLQESVEAEERAVNADAIIDFGGEAEGSGGVEPIPVGNGGAEIGGAHEPRYHHPILEDSSRDNPVGAPWFLSGAALPPVTESDSARPKRVTKPPSRYGFEGLVAENTISGKKIRRPPTFATGARNRAQQSKAGKLRSKHESAYILAVDRAISQFGPKAVDSLEKELSGLEQKSVFEQVMYNSLSPEQRKKVIRSKMFLKEKFLPDGTFDKLKSRLVAGGDMQHREDYDERDTSSPTVNLSSVYMVISVASKERRKVGSADVGMAYLNANISKDVFMKLDGRLAAMLVKLFPDKYRLDVDGRIYVKLKKALYGCIESAKLWFDEISKSLKEMGFVPNPYDQCVFNTQRNGHQVTVCLYVDDLLITSVDEDDIGWVAGKLREKYGTVTLNVGNVHSYLGQTFDMGTEGEVSVSMDGYVKDILESNPVTGYRATPAATTLYSIDETLPLLPDSGQEAFHSLVMKLMFLAQRARPDILTAVSFLSRRWGKATSEDKEKLDRILQYLAAHPLLKMTLSCDDELRVYCYVDASFAVHKDMKSHTGGIISLGKGSVHVSSKKQGLMTKSSTESELVGMSDQVPQAIWSRNFLLAQGHAIGPVKIYQDNMSTIALAEKGRSTSSRTRHVAIRYFFVKDKVDQGEVEIEYLRTEDMRADMLTKPLQGELFRKMRAELMGMREYSAKGEAAGGTASKSLNA